MPVYSDSDEEEDFPTLPLDDKHWTSEIVPERTFCIHKNGLPNNVCQHPCPCGNTYTVSYLDSLDLNDILDYEDYMMTTSDDEIPGMEEVHILTLNSGFLGHLFFPIKHCNIVYSLKEKSFHYITLHPFNYHYYYYWWVLSLIFRFLLFTMFCQV